MRHATPTNKLAAALTSAALACGAFAPAASAHYGNVGSPTEAGPTVPARQDPSGSPWTYVGVGGALLSGGLIFTAARRKGRRAHDTELPAASA